MGGLPPPTRAVRGTPGSRDQVLAGIQHLLDFVTFDHQMIWIIIANVRCSNDGHGVNGNDDVTVGRVDAAVHYGVDQPVVHSHHDAASGHNLNVVLSSHSSDVAAPWASRVHSLHGISMYTSSPVLSAWHHNAANGAVLDVNIGDAMVSQAFGPVLPSGFHGAPDHAPAVNGSVLDFEGPRELPGVRRAARLRASAIVISAAGTPVASAPLIEPVGEFVVVPRNRNKQTTGGFHGIGVNPLENCVFFGTLSCRLRIGHKRPAPPECRRP